MNKSELEKLDVRPVSKGVARELIVANHYSKTWNTAFGLQNYGIYRDRELLGVAVYGHAMNPRAWDGVANIDNEKCLELNRLWIDDILGANVETWFISQTFRFLKKDGYRLIQSFADGRLGVGTIYQAANFTYHGSHETIFHKTEDGTVWHNATFNNSAKARGMLFRNMFFLTQNVKTFTVKTYRYLYGLDRIAKKSILLPALPYPKERLGIITLQNYRPPAGQIARCVAVADAIGDFEKKKMLRLFLNELTDNPEGLIAEAMENEWIKPLFQNKDYMLDFESLFEEEKC